MTDATKIGTKGSEIYRHRRRGTLYTVVGRAILQPTGRSPTNKSLSFTRAEMGVSGRGRFASFMMAAFRGRMFRTRRRSGDKPIQRERTSYHYDH